MKSTKGYFGAKVVDGAYSTKIERLKSNTNPSLLLLSHKQNAVTNLVLIPKHYFVPSIIEKRRPLRDTARRAGWVGSNIVLANIPGSGRIYIVRAGQPQPREQVQQQWERTEFLAQEPVAARGWLVEVMHTIEALGKAEFGIDEVYADESRLRHVYPENSHVKEKIRQQLQVLRDRGYLEFASRGTYRLRRRPAVQ